MRQHKILNMENEFEYAIFKTDLGYFGIVTQSDNLIRTYLPGLEKEKLKTEMLKFYRNAKCNQALLKNLQQQIKDYLAGRKVDFKINIEPAIKDLSDFSKAILKACHKIPSGQTINYNQLANLANYPKAARAAGTVLSKNPLPLIIPCHRIIKSTGQIGNFNAPTGKNLKQKMLYLESLN